LQLEISFPEKKGLRITFPITARTATIKDFALEWEIACGFVQQTFFVAHGQHHVLF